MAENKTIYKFCKKHGETEYVLYKDGKFRCKKCAVEAVQRRRQKIKEGCEGPLFIFNFQLIQSHTYL